MCDTVDSLTDTDTLVIVSVCVGVSTIDILRQLSAVPCQCCRADRRRVADGVVGDTRTVIGGQ